MNNLEEFKQHVQECYPQEACGLVIDSIFLPMANVAEEPVDSFRMEQGTFLAYENRIDCIVHSHTYISPDKDPRTPSLADLSLAKTTTLPMGIIHTDGNIVSDVLYFNTRVPEPLLDRPYIAGVYDCYTIVRDFLILEYQYFLDILPRPHNWEEWDKMYMLNNLDNQGLKKIPSGVELVRGDVLVLRIGSTLPNHVGIYTGNGKFIHHLNRRVSMEDTLEKWDRQIYSSYRLIQ